MCSCCLVSHIRREPEAETKDAVGASEATAAEQQKQHKNWVTTQGHMSENQKKTWRKYEGRPR